MAENEQIPSSNSLRQELEVKIDKKLPSAFFYWVMGIFGGAILTISITVFGTVFQKIDKSNDRINGLDSRITVIETLIEKPSQRK